MLLPKSAHAEALQLPDAEALGNWALRALETHLRRALRRADDLVADGGASRELRVARVSAARDASGPRGPIVLWRVPLRADMGEAVHAVETATASALVDALLGSPTADTSDQGLTALDCAILGAWAAQLASRLLGPVLDPGSRGAVQVEQAKKWRMRLASEDGVAVLLELRAGEACGSLAISLPTRAALKLAASALPASRSREVIAVQLRSARVQVQARLITTTLSLAEVASLRSGDTLVLDVAPGDGAELLINGRGKFVGKAGFMDGRIAFQVCSRTAPGAGHAGAKSGEAT